MRWFRFTVLVLVVAVLQTGFAGLVAVIHPAIRVDLLVILLVFFAVYCNRRDAVIVSFAIGFAADLAHPGLGFMGPKIISFGLVGTLLSDLNDIFSIRRMSYQAVTIFVVGVLTGLLSLLLAHLRVGPVAANLGRELFWQPLLSGIIGPFLFFPVGWWMHIHVR